MFRDDSLAALLAHFAEHPQVFAAEEEFVEQLVPHREGVCQLFASTTDACTKLVTAGVLARIDPSQADLVLPVLMQGLERGDKTELSFSAYCLGLLGPISTPALPFLTPLLKDDNLLVACHTAQTLGHIRSPSSVPYLIAMLEHAEVQATDAARALGEMGHAAREAVPALQECLRLDGAGNNSIRSLRLAAAEAIWRISGDATAALAVATEILGDNDHYLCFHACHLLADLGPMARPTAANLQELLHHWDRCVREQAAQAFVNCWFG